MDPSVLVIGEALIDVVRRPDLTERRLPGGSPMNVAIGLGRLGHPVTLATWIGRDPDGESIAAHCAGSRVRLLPGSDQGARTSTAAATVDDDGQASYDFDLDWRTPAIPATEHPAVVHTGSLGALLEPGGDDALAYVTGARADALITFDPNCRPSIMGEAAAVRARVERYLAAADLVKVSDEDLAWLYPEATTVESRLDQAHRWAGAGPAVVVVTLGADGAVAFTRDQEVTGGGRATSSPPSLDAAGSGGLPARAPLGHPAEALRVEAVSSYGLADTVGAGDSFMSGLIHGLIVHGWADPARRSLFGRDRAALGEILVQAATIAGITVSRAGANPPWLDEL